MHDERKVLEILGRTRHLFEQDLKRHADEIGERIGGASLLVLGGAGSIGRELVKALFLYRPARLHVVDLSENKLVELVRDLRSSAGYIDGDFRTLALDCGAPEFDLFWDSTPPYDAVLNLTALKHVRSEKDPFTLMRMLRTNVLNTERTLQQSIEAGVGRYFAVSSDKAAHPANAMGASKRAMELCLVRAADRIHVSSTRFANVAFSDGSLLQGFGRRLAKRQPLAAPLGVQRYFITGPEAGRLCLLAATLGDNLDAFIPKSDDAFPAIDFRAITERYLRAHDLEPVACDSEDEARSRVEELAARGQWPCFFQAGDTTGEKPLEEFTIEGEEIVADRFAEIDVIRWRRLEDEDRLDGFVAGLREALHSGSWSREQLLDQIKRLVPEFEHRETGKFLDARM